MANQKSEVIELNSMAKMKSETMTDGFVYDPDVTDAEDQASAGRSRARIAKQAESRLKSAVDPAIDSLIKQASISGVLKDWLDDNLPDLVEQRLKALLRPLLKQWFDQHLPTMVDRIVRAEIERIVANSGER